MDPQSSAMAFAPDQKVPLNLCSIDNLSTIRKFLEETGPYSSTEPMIHELLTQAVSSKQTLIVRVLLQSYPSISISEHMGLVHAIRKRGRHPLRASRLLSMLHQLLHPLCYVTLPYRCLRTPARKDGIGTACLVGL